jgi:hypothetical protein
MIAWTAYKTTDDFAHSKKWAAYPEHVDGSLWAAFEKGFWAALSLPSPSQEKGPPVSLITDDGFDNGEPVE